MTDLRVKRGDTIELAIGPILKSDLSVQNITGYTVKFTAKYRLSDSDVQAPLFADGTIVDGPAGTAKVVVSNSQTAALDPPVTLYWDVQLRDPTGATKTVDSGKLYVEQDVTIA